MNTVAIILTDPNNEENVWYTARPLVQTHFIPTFVVTVVDGLGQEISWVRGNGELESQYYSWQATLKNIFGWLVERKYDEVLVIDIRENTFMTPAKDFLAHGAPLVLGSRFSKTHGGFSVPFWRYHAHCFINWLSGKIVHNGRLTDWTCGFYLIKRGLLQQLLRQDASPHFGLGWQVELRAQTLEMGAPIAQVPVVAVAEARPIRWSEAWSVLGAWWRLSRRPRRKPKVIRLAKGPFRKDRSA